MSVLVWFRNGVMWATQPAPVEPSTPTVVEPFDAQSRLAQVEELLAAHARSEGRVPRGSVHSQISEILDRLRSHEVDVA